MLCKECGSECNSSEVFCPNCGAPLRVTADYDYIQAEIGTKVDQFIKDDLEKPQKKLSVIGMDAKDANASQSGAAEQGPSLIGEKPRRTQQTKRPLDGSKENKENTIAVTRTIFVKDSIFADEEERGYEEEDDDLDFTETDNRRFDKTGDRSVTRKQRLAAERAKKKKRKTIIIIAVIAAVLAAGVILLLSLGKNNTERVISDVITCSVEDGGSYQAPMDITLWSEQDYRIVYTLDGSEPTVSTGMKYGQPIPFTNKDVKGESTEITLTAYSYTTNSSVKAGEVRVTFTLSKSTLAAPWMDLESGDYTSALFINIYAEEGASIYYTYDGSTPSQNSTKYTGPIEMKRGNYVLSAIAIDDSGVVSDVSSAVYNLTIVSAVSYEAAVSSVVSLLMNQELIDSGVADSNGFYKVPGGGTRRIINGGQAIVDNANYYVIQVDYMNDGSNVQATSYYGVDDQTGEVIKLNRSGMSFILG